MAQKIIHWLLFSLVLSLGFGQLLRFELYGVPVYVHDLLVVGSLIFLAPNFINYQARNFLIPAGLKIFCLGLAFSWLYAFYLYPFSSLLIPGLYTLRLLAYLALYFSLKQSKIILPNSYFLISGILTLLIGYLQYFLLPDMRIFQYLGWDDHLNRLTLPHFDPTFTGVMLGLALLSMISTTSSFLIPLIYLPAIFLTYSRSVWLSLFVVGLVYSIQTKKYARLFLAVILLGLVIMIQPKKFGEGTNLLRLFSVESRVVHDFSYVKKYSWELLVGRGINTLLLDTPESNVPNHATGPNNSYLYLLLTSGILGLVGWGIFLYTLYSQSPYKPILLLFFIASLFNNVMFYPFALLWILIVESQSKT